MKEQRFIQIKLIAFVIELYLGVLHFTNNTRRLGLFSGRSFGISLTIRILLEPWKQGLGEALKRHLMFFNLLLSNSLHLLPSPVFAGWY